MIGYPLSKLTLLRSPERLHWSGGVKSNNERGTLASLVWQLTSCRCKQCRQKRSAFSRGLDVKWSRANLGSKTIEQMECLKQWLKNGWLHQLNIDLPGERGGEEVEDKSGMRRGDSMASCASHDFGDLPSDTSLW